MTPSDQPKFYDAGDNVWFGVGYDTSYFCWRVQRYLGEPILANLLWSGTFPYRTEQEARDKTMEITRNWRRTYPAPLVPEGSNPAPPDSN